MKQMWACPTCRRAFTRTHQRHACGLGDPAQVLRDRPAGLVALYGALEQFVRSLGPVELVTRERYVLFRRDRVFADAIIMSDAIRLAIHLERRVAHALFVKVATDGKRVTVVAKLRLLEELDEMKELLREAFAHATA
ncbi:DUF5655 domain-containing protein [Xanthomonas sp. LMC-A-07]|uniref:DUF5655 domain-containing protein n=1 Tax=Xanthomonas sp. LMC-A-07 TaxID=3040329 RepID=UPI00255215A3|nr:DUF5655 domain-containing protein [Xanthomonas sp. LMC-A-07]